MSQSRPTAAWFADLGYEVRFVWRACHERRTLRPLLAKILYHASRLGRGGGVGRVSGPTQRLSFRVWSGVLINPKPLRGAVLAGLRSLDSESAKPPGVGLRTASRTTEASRDRPVVLGPTVSEGTILVYEDTDLLHLPGPNSGTPYTACGLDAGAMRRWERPEMWAGMWCSRCMAANSQEPS